MNCPTCHGKCCSGQLALVPPDHLACAQEAVWARVQDGSLTDTDMLAFTRAFDSYVRITFSSGFEDAQELVNRIGASMAIMLGYEPQRRAEQSLTGINEDNNLARWLSKAGSCWRQDAWIDEHVLDLSAVMAALGEAPARTVTAENARWHWMTAMARHAVWSDWLTALVQVGAVRGVPWTIAAQVRHNQAQAGPAWSRPDWKEADLWKDADKLKDLDEGVRKTLGALSLHWTADMDELILAGSDAGRTIVRTRTAGMRKGLRHG